MCSVGYEWMRCKEFSVVLKCADVVNKKMTLVLKRSYFMTVFYDHVFNDVFFVINYLVDITFFKIASSQHCQNFLAEISIAVQF